MTQQPPARPKKVIERHTSAQAEAVVDELGALHTAAYAGTPHEHDPFISAERFAERLRGYMRSPGFLLITAREQDAGPVIAYAFGYLLPPEARWWNGLLDPVPDDLIRETGTRTLALNELHVRADHRGTGMASAVHHAFTKDGPQERVTVLVRPDNPAQEQYEHWGYRQIGRLKPFPDSPTFRALILQL